MGPNGVLVQSIERISLPISPPPTSQSSGRAMTLVDELFEESASKPMGLLHGLMAEGVSVSRKAIHRKSNTSECLEDCAKKSVAKVQLLMQSH